MKAIKCRCGNIVVHETLDEETFRKKYPNVEIGPGLLANCSEECSNRTGENHEKHELFKDEGTGTESH